MNLISDQIGLDLVRVYVAVCRQGSLNKVALQTRKTQSAISMQMRKLEHLLDRRLLQRTGRGVVPTEEGEIFLAYATRILALSDEASLRLQEEDVSRTMRIGIADEVARANLSGMLAKFHHNYRDVRLDVVVDHSLQLAAHWEDGSLDIMVAPTSAVGNDALETWNASLLWVCAPRYVIPETGAIDVVALAAPCRWRQRMLDAISAMDRTYRIAFTSQSIFALTEAVACGFGIGLLPSDIAGTATLRTLEQEDGFPPHIVVQYGIFAREPRASLTDGIVEIFSPHQR